MNQYDKMTKTPVGKLIISLSIPTTITMLVTNIYNLADTMFVGKLGTSASGAVGIVFSLMSILQAIGFLFGQGSGSILSRQLGAKDKEAASVTASIGFFCSFILAFLVAIVCLANIDWIVTALGSTETIAPYAKEYIFYILIAAPFLVSSFTLNNILRYEGKARLGTIGMMTGAVLNIACDPLFMFKLDMGVAGAGLSTAVSQIIGFSVLIFMFISGKSETRIKISYLVKQESDKVKTEELTPLLGDIVGTGMPSLLRQALTSVSTIILNTLAGPYGDAAIAALGIVSKISFCVFSVALGIGQGFQPISAFNYGAGNYSRVREGFFTALLYSEVAITVVAVVVFVNSPFLISYFRDDASVVEIGTRALRIMVLAQITMPCCTMVEMLLQTTGHKIGSSLLSSSRSGLILIPCIIALAYLRGLHGLEEAQPLAMILSCIPAYILGNSFFKNLPKKDKEILV